MFMDSKLRFVVFCVVLWMNDWKIKMKKTDVNEQDEEWEEFEEEYVVLTQMEGLDAALMQQDLSYSLVVSCTV